jgi:hypothetical protein
MLPNATSLPKYSQSYERISNSLICNITRFHASPSAAEHENGISCQEKVVLV